MLPMAVMEFIIPTGTPRRSRLQITTLSVCQSSLQKRISSMRHSTTRHISPESSWASTVAHAAPATPHWKPTTNSTSRPTFTTALTTRITSGDTLSPSARRIPESIL